MARSALVACAVGLFVGAIAMLWLWESPCACSENSDADVLRRRVVELEGALKQRKNEHPDSAPATQGADGPARLSFRAISDAAGDDKSYRHQYDRAYTIYFEAWRSRKLRILEIGLGCDQQRIGASVQLWEQYFPNAHLTMIEYDRACGEKWKQSHPP